MRHAAFLLCLATLSGCVSLQQLKELNPSADDFASALASEYMAFSDSEAEQNRRFTAEHYAAKGLRSLRGEMIEPETPSDSLPAAEKEELLAARAKLITFLTDDMKGVAPQKLARAQLLYDCWQHELKRNINEDLAPCGDEFKATMVELQEVSDTLVYGKQKARTVDFEPYSTKLNDEAQETIKQIAKQLKNRQHYTVEVEAYIGIKSSQRKLSETRLAVVRQALIKEGVSAENIRIKKHGSAKAVILSKDTLAVNTKKVRITVKTDPMSEASE